MGILADWQIARDVGITDAQPNEKRPGKISYGYTSYGYDARAGYKWQVFSPIMSREIDPKAFDQHALVNVNLTPWEHNWQKQNGDMRKRGGYKCERCGEVSPHVHHELCKHQPENYILIPPHSFVLGETMERFFIPRDCLCIVIGKSTYARCGLIVNVTPGEPEWEGSWTVEISNTTPLPARVYCGEGIMQCAFVRSDGCIEKRANYWEMKLINQLKLAWSEEDEEEVRKAIRKGTCKISYADKKGKYQNQDGLTSPKVDKEEKK